MSSPLIRDYQRQVHLDFHTSPYISDVGEEFDAREFARTIKRAHINSITIFAKCHHGMSYYPTKAGTQHPALRGRDLMGEQIEALHREGIRCPIYTTVAWEEDVASKYPEWRQMDGEGRFLETTAVPTIPQPGAWKFNNFLHADYQDYIEAHIRELCADYEVDGLFFDILFMARQACWSAESLKFREKHGLLSDDQAGWERFNGAAQAAFAEKFTKLVKGLKPEATIFYNASNESNIDASVGPRVRQPHMTHFEIESLPSGFWGYYHFPRMARMQSHWGKFWLGQTGRFQKMWGDFGGIKPQAALEFECFRSQALGGGNSVGDQLPPRGTPDAAAYELIGAVYRQVEEAEAFYAGSKAMPQGAILSASYPGLDGGKSEEGAVQMSEECHYDFAVCDSESDLKDFSIVVLPDTTVITPALKETLEDFYAKGGRLILSYRAGFDAEGKWALDFLPLSFDGEVNLYPTYWRATEDFDPAMARSDRVFYQAGMNVKGGEGTEVLVQRVLPYFKRSDLKFSSHFQTPPVHQADRFPAVLAGERFVYFADPIFREYRQAGNLIARDGWRTAMRRLVGPAPFGEGLPTTVVVYPRRRSDDLLLTLLHYIPVRKALDIDIIEERSSFAGELLRLPAGTRPRVYQEKDLPISEDGAFELPNAKGRLLIEVPGYFQRRPIA
jgi:Hypothetical glycosyl hydrolase 6/Beta-galactosidase trimerisation domain